MSVALSLSLGDPHRVIVDGITWLDLAPSVAPGVNGDVRLSATALDDTILVLTLAATNLRNVAGAGFADPQIGWSIRPALDTLDRLGVRSFGYQYMEFALPSAAGPDGRGLAPWPLRPPVAMPVMWGGNGHPTLLIGPLDHPHESIIAVPSDEVPRDDLLAGWHGDLDEIDELTSRFVVLVASDPRSALRRYGDTVLAGDPIPTVPPRRGAHRVLDPAVTGLSYWTDNGAEYYYRAAPGRDYPETIGEAVAALRGDGLPPHAVQLDSWFYPHETPRGIGQGAAVVPPSGALSWEPRDDALPGGFAAVRAATNGLPIVLHSRHFAVTSPYFTRDGFAAYLDEESGHAQPVNGDLLDVLMEQAAQWGACTYEQDWLVEIFLTVRGLRSRPGRADAWMDSMDSAAARRGLTLQLCMGTPATMLAATSMSRVSSVRTSMDYRYLADRQGNWGWFLHVNALARALDLPTSKDVFVTVDDEWAEVEACLAALSCGPVGVGDPIGATETDLVSRTCREDGVLIAPDVPVAAVAGSFYGDPMGSAVPVVGEATSEHPAGRWHYVVACAVPEASRPVRVELGDLDGATGPYLARRDRDGTIHELAADGATGITLEPGPSGLDLWVLAPLLAGGRCAVFGDVSKFASAGGRRVAWISERADEVSFLVYGPPGVAVTVTGWGLRPEGAVALDQAGEGVWQLEVVVGAHGWSRVSIRTL